MRDVADDYEGYEADDAAFARIAALVGRDGAPRSFGHDALLTPVREKERVVERCLT